MITRKSAFTVGYILLSCIPMLSGQGGDGRIFQNFNPFSTVSGMMNAGAPAPTEHLDFPSQNAHVTAQQWADTQTEARRNSGTSVNQLLGPTDPHHGHVHTTIDHSTHDHVGPAMDISNFVAVEPTTSKALTREELLEQRRQEAWDRRNGVIDSGSPSGQQPTDPHQGHAHQQLGGQIDNANVGSPIDTSQFVSVGSPQEANPMTNPSDPSNPNLTRKERRRLRRLNRLNGESGPDVGSPTGTSEFVSVGSLQEANPATNQLDPSNPNLTRKERRRLRRLNRLNGAPGPDNAEPGQDQNMTPQERKRQRRLQRKWERQERRRLQRLGQGTTDPTDAHRTGPENNVDRQQRRRDRNGPRMNGRGRNRWNRNNRDPNGNTVGPVDQSIVVPEGPHPMDPTPPSSILPHDQTQLSAAALEWLEREKARLLAVERAKLAEKHAKEMAAKIAAEKAAEEARLLEIQRAEEAARLQEEAERRAREKEALRQKKEQERIAAEMRAKILAAEQAAEKARLQQRQMAEEAERQRIAREREAERHRQEQERLRAQRQAEKRAREEAEQRARELAQRQEAERRRIEQEQIRAQRLAEERARKEAEQRAREKAIERARLAELERMRLQTTTTPMPPPPVPSGRRRRRRRRRLFRGIKRFFGKK